MQEIIVIAIDGPRATAANIDHAVKVHGCTVRYIGAFEIGGIRVSLDESIENAAGAVARFGGLEEAAQIGVRKSRGSVHDVINYLSCNGLRSGSIVTYAEGPWGPWTPVALGNQSVYLLAKSQTFSSTHPVAPLTP